MNCDHDNAPIVAGIGLRLPGARGLAAAWSVLSEGRCTVTTVSARSFDPAFYHDPAQGRRGKTYSLAAGQLDNLYHFDAAFFGISPREAAEMDPQQRQMLVATWEAVEDAGLDMADLSGPRTGVFIGSSIVENLSSYYYDTARGGSTFTLGNTLAIIANRISARFDFGGPSQVIDTACSSGLTALDTATKALSRGDLDIAIVGGVHVLRAPGGFVGFSQARMLSPSGRCRAFDAGADGYVRSEAAIALVLLRPEIAARLHARHRGRILATGVNTDGGASPLLVPSSDRQETLIRSVLDQAGRAPEDLAFYEAHGTGTQVGDPAEAHSIGRAVASLRRAPLLIGSAKSNFGHTEPASGLVGLVKALLAMQHRVLPASLHFNTPNPNIDFDGLNLAVAATPMPLPEGPLLAGVNAFGFGGTNAVALIEGGTQATPARRFVPVSSGTPWLCLSAASPDSLAKLAGHWSARLDASPHAREALAAAATRRTALPHRLALRCDETASARLRDIALGQAAALGGRAAFERPQTVFAFPGNGAQIMGMGQDAYRHDARFRDGFDQIAAAFAQEGIDALAEQLFAADLDRRLASPLVAQPLLVACQVAQAQSLMAAGLRPDAVIGHSVGELSALTVAGCLTPQGLARVVASRSRRFEALRGSGGMAALALSEAEASRAIAGLGAPLLALAAVNAPRSVTVSGPQKALEQLAKVSIGGKRIAMMPLGVEVPYHSPAVAPLRAAFMADIAGLQLAAPTCRIAGSALGRLLETQDLTADYLWRNARDTVRFSDALKSLCAEAPAVVVELSPRRLLAANIRDLARLEGQPLSYCAATPAQGTEPAEATVLRCWCHGARIDRTQLSGLPEAPPPDLPLYPWQEVEHATQLSPDGYDAWGEAGQRHFAGRRPDRELPVWTTEITPTAPEWLADHRIGGAQVLPAAALVELALSAAQETWPETPLTLSGFDLLHPADIAGEGLRLRTKLLDGGRVGIDMRPRLAKTDWTPLARGTLRPDAIAPPPRRDRPTHESIPTEALYTALAAQGLHYGPAFRRLGRIWAEEAGGLGATLTGDPPAGQFLLDPTALDAAFHLLAPYAGQVALAGDTPPALAKALAAGAALLPTRIGRLTLWPEAGPAATVRLVPGRLWQRGLEASFTLETADGRTLAALDAVEFTLARPDALPIAPALWHRRAVRLRPPEQPVIGPESWHEPKAALARLGYGTPPPRAETDLSDAGTVLRLHPDRASDLQLAMLQARGMDQPDIRRHSAATRACWQTAERLLDDLLGQWPAEERCALLLVGLPPGWLVTRLAADPRLDDLRLSHPDETARESLRRLLPAACAPLLRDPPEAGMFDIMVTALPHSPPLLTPLAAGGICVALSTEPVCGSPPDGRDQHGATPPVAPPPTEPLFYDGTGPVPVTISACRSPVPKPPSLSVAPTSTDRPAAATPPQGPPELRGLDTGGRNLRLIVRLHQGADDPVTALADMLAELRRATLDADDMRPLRLVVMGDGDTGGFAQLTAGLAAAVMVLRNEAPAAAASLISVQTDGLPDWEALFALADREPWVDCAGSALRAPRLLPQPRPAEPAAALGLNDRANGGQNGALNGGQTHSSAFSWQPRPRQRPRADEVEIAVAATGLNFRDVMLAKGLLPERLIRSGASGGGLGMEFAGIVQRVGRDAPLAKGMAVMGFAADAFATHLTVPAAAVMPLPEGLDLHQAAALPVAYVTAWEALRGVGRVSDGDIVLVHGGAGGLGLAAIRVARLFGARVFATASSAERQALAVAAGAEACFDSRTLDFADALRAATGGHGADIVLNSLAGEAMLRSVEALAPFGRFIELGKRGFVENAILPLGQLPEEASYHSFDLDRRLAARPAQLAGTLHKIGAALAEGRLPALPVTPFAAEDAAEAFGHMFAARQVGKIIITPPPLPTGPAAPYRPIRDDWVILGGTGGVGLALAKTLRENGAKRVHLLSRSGTPNLGSGAAGAWVAADQGTVLHALDGRDATALSAYMAQIDADGHRLGGVIHAAMVLRDRLIRDLDPVETALVLRAKLGVARSLDQVLRQRAESPDAVLFLSSVAACLGNPGQAAYAAANAAMEALAERRRADGHPASVLALGPIGDGGALARNAALSAQLGRLDGLAMLPMRTAVAEILSTLRDPTARNRLFAPLNWARLAPHLPALAAPPFSWIVPEGAAQAAKPGDLARALRGLEWPEALAHVERELADILCDILRLPAAEYDPHRPLGRYGIDSLMALELRLEIERRLGLQLASFPLSESTTPARFAVALLTRLHAQEAPDG
ncbi:SDR family NAD(P)-dependent oxidoreductase [Thioclava sp. GXIMD4215]|uniref:SDR family NAD(P)-dependent oxidoreductase n=1 Tax=Thioclava sp. GXIMD4215 TaxID=3131928 RepID=UPI00311AE5B6